MPRSKIAYLHHFLSGSRSHQADHGSFFNGSLHDAAENNDSFVGIIHGIENQGLKRRTGISRRRRDLRHDLLQHLLDADTILGRNQGRVLCFQADHVLDLFNHPLRLRTWQVDLVDHRKYIQIMIQGKIYVGQRLCFDPLGGIHHQHCAVAGRQRPAHLIVKIHVSRCVNQIENIFFSVAGPVYRANRLGLDGNSSFSLQVHVVQYLILHFPAGQQTGFLNNPVRQRRFSMVDMCNDTKVTDSALIHRCLRSSFSEFPMSWPGRAKPATLFKDCSRI